MDSAENPLVAEAVDWESLENHIFLNPRLREPEWESLSETARKLSQENNLRGHIWLTTSGSTAGAAEHVKLVALSKQAFLTSADSVNRHLQIASSDCWLQALPRFHVGGLSIEARAALSNSQIVSDTAKWEPTRVYKLLQEKKVTIASMVPTQIFDYVKLELPAPKYLRAVIVGGGALSESVYKEAKILGWPVLPSYGMTEACSQIATAPLDTLNSEFAPLPKKLGHIEWKTNSDGLLQVKTESLLTMYGQRQRDGSIRSWDPKENGWFKSGDFVELKDSYVRVVGRAGDFIKIGGESSSIARLRDIFEKVVHIVDSSKLDQLFLLEAPSERLGCEIHMVTTLPRGQTICSQIKDLYDREVLPFERIREIRYTEAVPRSELGKVLWGQLKGRLYGD